MNPETFFDNFGMLADTPNAVSKLRKLILQQAVQGKLVPQDLNDEPASVLLVKTKTEKERLVKEGGIKKSKTLFPPEINETLYELPNQWGWTRLGKICTKLVDGSHNPPPKRQSGIPMLSGQNVLDNKITFSVSRYISQDDYKKETDRTSIEEGDVFLTIVGTIGRSAVVPPNMPPCAIQRSIALLRSSIFPHYLSIFFRSPIAHDYFNQHGKGTAQKGIYLNKISLINVPVPPLAEQKRIVAKVDQLMALCDELEGRQQNKQEARLRLNSAALDKLLTAHEPVEFAHHWQRVCDNFDLLYDNPETVGELRKSILQLAVQGRLVRQDPNDEPAAVLLEKIRAEKERLVKEKMIKKSKPVSSNGVENPYELPVNWKWTRLFDIGVINPRNKASDDIDASFVPMTLISETYSTPVSSEKRPWGEIKTGFTHFAEEDVVLAKITPCFQNGKSAVMRNLLNGFGAGTTELHVFRPLLGESVYPEYVLLYLKSPQFLTGGIEKMTGTAGQKRVTRDYFAGNSFPLPPFEEQRRIVAKVDQLMALCDDLESKLRQSQTDGGILMEAVVHKLVAA